MSPTDVHPDPPERDLCDELLAPPVEMTDPSGLREQILRRTTGRLRWRRRLRRGALVGALFACWLGGMLTMRWLSPASSPTSPSPEIVQTQPQVQPKAESAPSANVLEWKAIDGSRDQEAILYRKAADAYLTEDHDPLSAVRCYGRSLDAAPEQTKTVSADDEWLLMAIKTARNKEKRDAKSVD